MPELPEVETVVRELRPRLLDRRFQSVRVGRRPLRHRWQTRWGPLVIGQRIERLHRRGKWIVMDLGGGPCLVLHLGMTGQLTVTPAETTRRDHTHLIFGLDPGNEELRFRDVRRFGCALYFPDAASRERFPSLAELGPEPFDLDPACWRDRLRATERSLKAALLDQHLVAGVGNIYADESLFAARLPPTRRGCDLAPAEADRLRRAVVAVLTQAIERRGSSIRDYIGGNGEKGGFQKEFRVYGQTGLPCRRCQTPIACIRLAGRATHFCPHCQKPPLVPPQRGN